MFERAYVLHTLPKPASDTEMTKQINDQIAQYDHPRAAASVACLTTSEWGLHVLIEYWREDGETTDGDTKQDTAGTVDPATTARKPRRARTRPGHDGRATQRDQPAGVSQPVEPTTRGAQGRVKEEDVPLPFDEQALDDGPIEWP